MANKVYRKLHDLPDKDLIAARFWKQPFDILEKTTFSDEQKNTLHKVLLQLAQDMTSLRGDWEAYLKELDRYILGVSGHGFYEKKGNVEYFHEVFNGQSITELFYFHAELCKRDVLRFLRIVLPITPAKRSRRGPTWVDYRDYFKTHNHYKRVFFELQNQWDVLMTIHEIRGVVEHADDGNDFQISDITLEDMRDGKHFLHLPVLQYPATVSFSDFQDVEKEIKLDSPDLRSLLISHFFSVLDLAEMCTVFPLYEKLTHGYQPKQLAINGAMSKENPIRWTIEPASKPKRTVGHPPV